MQESRDGSLLSLEMYCGMTKNGDNIINSYDRQVVGNIYPKWQVVSLPR